MTIQFCPLCQGRPYTEDLSVFVCPACGSALQMEDVADIPFGRPMLPLPSMDADPMGAAFGSEFDETEYDDDERFSVPTPEDPVPAYPAPGEAAGNQAVQPLDAPAGALVAVNHEQNAHHAGAERKQTIRGKVAQYSNSENEPGHYRRFLVIKLFDAIVYHQRLEDVRHRFFVRVNHGMDQMGFANYTDVPVNVHGTIAGGMNIADNAEVEVQGKFRRNGTLMASRIDVISNGANCPVEFQRSVSAIVYGVLAVAAVIALIVFVANADGSFFSNLKYFLITWLFVSIVVTILYLVVSFSRLGLLRRLAGDRKRRFPIIAILLFSLVITMIVMNTFGLGTTIGGLLSKLVAWILPIAVGIIIIVLVVKLLFAK